MRLHLTIFFILFYFISFSQITSSGIRGIINIQSGQPPENVTVQALHVPTGSVYNTVSQKEGVYNLPNLRSGGPYTITFTAAGFAKETVEDIQIQLGDFFALNITLQLNVESLSEIIVSTPPQLTFSNPQNTPWQYDPILSRAQGLLTLRYTW